MNTSSSLALDRSLRSLDEDKLMRVEESRISKATVNPYFGRDIPRWDELGLNPDTVYHLLRDPRELEKAADTFTGKPLLIRHAPVHGDLPEQDLWVGTVGKVTWEPPYLVARPLTVLTTEARQLIESGQQRELSSGYRYDADMTPGTYGGRAYDGVMRNIRGNHVAIVSEGRAGPDVHVADELPGEFRMKRSEALTTVLKPLLRDGVDPLRVSMAFDALLGETEAKSVVSLDEREEALDARECAMDESEEEREREESAKDEAEEKDDEGKEEKEAEDRKHARDKRKHARDKARHARDARKHARDKRAEDRKHAKDEAAKHTAQNKDSKHGKDGDVDHRKDFDLIKAKDELRAELREELSRQFREAAIARDTVKPLVGVVSLAMDSAEEIYRFALERTGNKRARSAHVDALPDMIASALNAKKPQTASHGMDSTRGASDWDAIFRAA